MKKCNKCGETKALDAFYSHPSTADKLQPKCAACHALYGRQRRAKKEAKNIDKNSRLIKRFGISLDQYNQMFIDQQGCCKICKKHQSEFKIALAVDHCHITGKVRGLLCSFCNTSIGLMNHNINILAAAMDYLQ